jgi:hypothetical protein
MAVSWFGDRRRYGYSIIILEGGPGRQQNPPDKRQNIPNLDRIFSLASYSEAALTWRATVELTKSMFNRCALVLDQRAEITWHKAESFFQNSFFSC